MIEHYTDHAANERTYLAWIRTAISIMAFGFLIEKFDLFLETLAGESANKAGEQAGIGIEDASSTAAEVVGLALFVVGALIVISATLRFYVTKANIDAEEKRPYGERRSTLMLSALMVILVGFLLYYVLHQFY